MSDARGRWLGPWLVLYLTAARSSRADKGATLNLKVRVLKIMFGMSEAIWGGVTMGWRLQAGETERWVRGAQSKFA